jgi:starch synthase
VERAVSCYKDKELWEKLMLQAMGYDFSWTRSAKQYFRLYRKLMG